MTAPAEGDLVPARALNQVTYCPRLYYLQYVEAVMPVNEHVEDGLFEHRRVNDPDLANRPRKDGEVVQVRSVSLSSERLGVTAKLDVVEEKDGATYPVEHKRGGAPRDEAGRPSYWLNDAVQLCAQGMLLEEELGKPVERGVLSYLGTRAVGAAGAAGAAAGDAAAPLPGLFAGDGVSAGGGALRDRQGEAGARGGGAGGPDARATPDGRRGGAVRAGAGGVCRQAERAPHGAQGGHGAGPGAVGPGAAGGGVRQRAGVDAGAGGASGE